MFDNAAYHRALVAHIVAVLLVLTAILAVVAELGRVRRASTAASMAAHARRGATIVWATVLFAAVALVPAVYMVPKKWSWQQGWVRTALVAGVLLVLLLATALGPAFIALARAARRAGSGPPPAALQRQATHPRTWAAAQIVTTIYTGNVLLMLFKPRPPVSALVLVVAVLLGLLSTLPALLRYRRLGRALERAD